MNANEVIANRANEILGGARGDLSLCGPNDHVNMAQSTNDTIPCAIHISAAEAVRHDLLSAVAALHKTLAKKANEFMPVVKSGRTHLQDAVPIRLGQEFAAWASAVKRDISRIEHAAQTLLELPLGGNAVGTGINAHPKYRACAIKEIARITKMPFRPMENMFEGIQNVVGALELSAALRGLAVTLSRIANDVRLLASGPRTGLAELLLPAVQPGSSIMPGKVNPVMSEMLNMVCIQVAGNDAAVSMAAQSGQLELNVMMPVMAHNLLQSITILANGASAFNARCLAGLKADKKQCSHWMGRSLAIATALNPAIGYHKAAAVSKRAHAENKTVLEVVVEQGILPEAEARKLLDAEKLV
jgi:fumarate hydratase class II